MTAKKLARLLNRHHSLILVWLAEGRFPGASKPGKEWEIPDWAYTQFQASKWAKRRRGGQPRNRNGRLGRRGKKLGVVK